MRKAAMALVSIEHGRAAYWADFWIYGAAVSALSVGLAAFAPREDWLSLAAWVALGAAAWTLIEYALHRFVLHALEPFLSWHANHHERPTALISTPTVLSSLLLASLVFLPSLLVADAYHATALTLGVVAGYLAYALTHHATHHWRSRWQWIARRKRWHALHHHKGGCYGVTCTLWDRVFGSAGDGSRPPRGLRTASAADPRQRPIRQR